MKKRDLKDYNRLLREESQRVSEQKSKVEIELFHLKAKQILEPIINGGEIKLLQDENNEIIDELNDLQADWAESNVVAGTAMLAMVQDINDLQADMAADHADYREQVIKLVTQRTRESDLAVRLQSRIAELQNENEKLRKKILRLNGMGEAQR